MDSHMDNFFACMASPRSLPRDGQSRQMAFVGYKSEPEAQSALKYFDRSFIDTFRWGSCRITAAVLSAEGRSMHDCRLMPEFCPSLRAPSLPPRLVE